MGRVAIHQYESRHNKNSLVSDMSIACSINTICTNWFYSLIGMRGRPNLNLLIHAPSAHLMM